MVCLDLALVVSLLMVQTYAAAVRSADVASGIWPLPSSVQLGMRGPEPLDFGCHVAVEGGNATFTLGTLLPVLLCALAPLVVTEFFSLVSFFPDMRRVRRQLKPLNDLALKADALVSADTLGAATRGPTASGEDKMASLEQAIERAQQQHSGSRALSAEIDMRRDRAEYEVEVMTTDKRIYDIRIDAVNGNVLENREDHDD